jgi:hypothetical protein
MTEFPPPNPNFHPDTTPLIPRRIKFPSGAGKAYRILIIILACLTTVATLAAINLYGATTDIRDGAKGLSAINRFDDANTFLDLVLGIFIYVSIAAFVLEIIWTYRMSIHLRASGRPPRMSDGMAIGGFFIPAANFVIPWLYKADFVRSLTHNRPSSKAPSGSLVATAWWLRVGTVIASFVSAGLADDAELSLSGLLSSQRVLIGSLIALVISFILTAITIARFDADSDDFLKGMYSTSADQPRVG